MRNFFLFTLLFCVLSCTKNETPKENVKPYIISERERKIKEKTKKGNFLPPPKGYYGEFQIVIDTSNNFYCYQQEDQSYIWDCVIDKNDTLPQFLGIQPKDLLGLNSKNITDIIDENVLSKPKKRQILIIASQKDTIRNTTLLNYLKITKIPTYTIRRTTQEEDTVLHYKQNNAIYYSNEIKWDYTKMKPQVSFPPMKIKN